MTQSCAMLINERDFYQRETVFVMSDIAILAASVKTTLLEIAKQANALGTGLQNAAPGDAPPNSSVLYLLKIAESLHQSAESCEVFLSFSSESNQNKT